jgi:hypothetical protein
MHENLKFPIKIFATMWILGFCLVTFSGKLRYCGGTELLLWAQDVELLVWFQPDAGQRKQKKRIKISKQFEA